MLDFIINPRANKGKARKQVKKLENYLLSKSLEYRFHYTTKEKEAINLTKEIIEHGATDIIAVGGDGTINEVANGLCNLDKVRFGIIPCGSGNDFAATLKIPSNKPEKAFDIISSGNLKPIDYMECDGVRGVNIIGTGIDVEILKRCKTYSKILKGKLQYVISLLISLIKFKFYKFKVVKNELSEEKEALIACVGNGKQLGGGIKICPDAIPDDGLMDFVVAKKMKKIKIPGALLKLMKGKIRDLDFISYSREKALKIIFEKPIAIQIDGEIYENLNFDVKIIHNGINMFRP